MQPDKIAELLKNYRAYKYAVNQYERHNPYPSAGVANYDAMPGGSGAPSLFFDRVGKAADMGNTSLADALDYRAYKSAVEAIETAMQVLTEEEHSVVRLKWMDDVTLRMIAQRKYMSEMTVKRIHKRAIASLSKALRFYEMPPIQTDFIPKYKYTEQLKTAR